MGQAAERKLLNLQLAGGTVRGLRRRQHPDCARQIYSTTRRTSNVSPSEHQTGTSCIRSALANLLELGKDQTPLHGHRIYGHVVQHHQRTPPTDELTTNLPHRNARAQHLDMSRCWDVANFSPLVVNLLYNKL